MADLKKFIKEFISDRIIAKFQQNVDNKFTEQDLKLKELEARIYALEHP